MPTRASFLVALLSCAATSLAAQESTLVWGPPPPSLPSTARMALVKGDPKQAAVACGAKGKARKGKPAESDATEVPPPLSPEDEQAMREYLTEEVIPC